MAMWRIGGRAATAVGRRGLPTGLSLRLAAPAGVRKSFPSGVGAAQQALWQRAFCDSSENAAPSKPAARPRGKKAAGGGPPKAAILLGAVGAAAVAYNVSKEAQDAIDEALDSLCELWEDFNDISREWLERMGDKIVSNEKTEPWLLELETMKYPESIPTLVLDVDKVILYLAHDSKTGWHVIKRPFADQFFKEISHYYEVVLFSDDVFPVAIDIATKWNLPVTGVLHRDFCKKKRQHYIKDLSKLGRKLDKVIMIDHDPEAFRLQPANGIVIKPFTGDLDDCELNDLLPFLKAAATQNQDLREFVARFGGGDEDLGRRYLIHKQEQDLKVEQRRSVSRAFAGNRDSVVDPRKSGFQQMGGPRASFR